MGVAETVCDYEDNIDPSIFFDSEGNFKAFVLMVYITGMYDIVYVPESGFYIYDLSNNKIWQKVNDNFVCNIIHRKLGNESKSARINETLNLLKFETNITFDKLNNNKNRFVLKNGTLDISDWKNPIFYNNEYFKEDYSTIQLSCAYNKSAKMYEFNKFLSTTFDDDIEIIKIIQELLGYVLTTCTKYEKAFLFYGEV